MKNIFLCLTKANATLKTGGGDSQILKHFWQYTACLLLAFVLGIGQMWATYSFNHATSVPEWTVNFNAWNSADDASSTTAETVHNPRLSYNSGKSKYENHSQNTDIAFDGGGFYYIYNPGSARHLPSGEEELAALCYVVFKSVNYPKYGNTSSTASSPSTLNGLTANSTPTAGSNVALEIHAPKAGYIRILMGTDNATVPSGGYTGSLSGATTGSPSVTYYASAATYDIKTRTGATTFSTTTITSSSQRLKSVEFAVNKGTTTLSLNPSGMCNSPSTARKFLVYAVEMYLEEESGGSTPSIELSDGTVNVKSKAGSAFVTATTTLSGSNLTNGTYNVTTSASGLSISPTSFTVSGGSVSQTFTVSYTGSSSGSESISFSDGTTSTSLTANYSTQAVSSDATLSSVTIGGVAATLAGSAGSYTAKIDRSDKGFSMTQDVAFTTSDANATVKLTNASGEVITSVTGHNFGNGNLVLYVLAEDGSTNATYTVSITTYDKYLVYITTSTTPSENIYSTLSTYATAHNYKLSVWNVDNTLSAANMASNYDLVILAEAPGSGKSTAQAVGSAIGNVPVLNFKAFMFGKTNWPSGAGNNLGTGENAIKTATALVPCHTIYNNLSLTGASTTVTFLSSDPTAGSKNGVQAISGVSASGWRSLAKVVKDETTYSALLEYTGTAGANKAIVIPISDNACANISTATQTIIGNAVAYLLDNTALYTINTTKTITGIHVAGFADGNITDNGDGTYALESASGINSTDNAVTVDLSSNCAFYSVDYSGLTEGYGGVTITVTAESGAEGTYTLTVTATTPSGYAITKSAVTNGTIAVTDGSDAITSADEDDVVYIAATPATGYQFSSWSIYETETPANTISPAAATASTTFTMPAANVTVGATFSAIDYTVTHSAATNGTYTIKVGTADATDATTTANYGQTVTLAATPASGYVLSGWTVVPTAGGDAITVTNNQFTMPAKAVTVSATFEEVSCPTEGSVYSASTSATGDISIAASTSNLELNSSTHKTTVSGGKMYVYNGQTSAVNLITSSGFCITNGNTYFHIQLDCALEAGDVISVKVGKHSNARGVWISSTRTDNVPASAPACALTTTGTGSELKAVTYTVTGNDEYHGKSDFYIYRATSNSTYFNDITITRPEKFTVTYWKNDGTETKTEDDNAAVIAANEFTRTGYRFIEWNTQADGEGTTVAVGSAVTADKEVYAIWAQEYSVSYANTDAASGAAPTNENKYIAGETFKVAGVGSMVAAENYAFGGWDDGSNIYVEDDDYTVGSANVSFTPVWNLHYTVTYKANGGTGSDIVVDNPAKVADCVFETPENKLFDKWNASAEGDGANYAVGADVSSSLILYAIWKDDECTTNRKSIFKAVLTGDATATVTGENGKEYAGEVLINKLGGSDANRTTDATIEGVGSGLTTYKMNGTGAYMYGTLKKGAFQEGDKIQFAVSSTPGTLAIYGTKSSDLSQRVHIADMPAPNEAKVFTYTLTAANATALAGYDAIGIYRADGVTMNPFLYSLEITGCRVWTITHDVTFDMKSHGTQVEKQTLEVGAKVTEPTEPEAAGYIFGGWYKETTLENKWNFSTDVVPDNDITLYAKWTEDPCTDRQSLSKVVLTSKTEGTVSGYNSKEYAGDAVIGGLNETQTAEVDDSHEGTETGYKLSGSGTGIVFATLAKGTFQEGDKVVVTITKQQDAYKVEEVAQPILDIYYGTSKDDATFLTTINNVTAAGTYTYRLTAADVTAIGDKKGIGVFRPSSGRTQNPYVYSVEITGCRDWSVSHNVTFNMHDHGSAIAAQSVYEGGKVTKPAVVEPEGWAFDGWYKESTYENLWDFDVDVMGTSDIELHAKWESEAGVIKLFDGEGNLNTTNFISAAKTTIEINEVEYPTLADFGSNRTSLSQAKQADMVMYSATTDATKIKFELYNANGSAKSAYLWLVEEGDAAATAIDVVEVPGNERLTTSYYTFNGTKNRSFYLTSGSKADIKVMQVKVMDNGTAIPQFGKAGYSVDFNKGRIAVASNGTVSFEGASIHSNDEYSVLNNESIKPKTYIQFNNAVANTTVKIKKASSNKYYVTNDLDNKGTEYSTDQEIVLTTTGTWYIGSVNSGSVAALSKIEFIAPKCEAPAFNALANSDICSGDAYVALDGTGTVSDGGSISYKWYADGDAENVLATTATYMPEADGSYYVVALHHVDGYTDNEATSDVVTVTTYEGTAITEGLVNLRGAIDDVVTLSVTATGKNLQYTWKECATIDGTYTAVDGATSAASLDVTITEGLNKYFKVIVHSDCGEDQESIAKVEQFIPVAQANVTTSIIWDWKKAASVDKIQLTASTTPKKNDGFVMANGAATIYNNANFESDKLYLEGEYIVRDGDKANPYFQGQLVSFRFAAATEGVVRITYSHTSGTMTEEKPAREIYINDVATGEIADNATFKASALIPVNASEVTITARNINGTASDDKQYLRIAKIEFYALDMVRDDSWIAPGELGTVCYPNGHIVVGADMYKMAGVDENHKFAFDQVEVTEPGVPYLFEATGYDPIKFYKTTAAAADEAGTSNGMVGTFVDKILTPAEGENLYYFQGAHFYSVADRTKNLSVPANRCYVDLNEPHPAMAPKAGVRRISFGVTGMNVTTGIENGGLINGENGAQKVLIDGQLFILRGEKMYDATGRLVK